MIITLKNVGELDNLASATFLGVDTENSLSWASYISKTANKIIKSIY